MVREPSPLPNYHSTQINQRSRSAVTMKKPRTGERGLYVPFKGTE